MEPTSSPVKLNIAPGFFSEATDTDARGRWKTGDRVRFKNGLPEKMGGWENAGIFNVDASFGPGFIGRVLATHLDGTNGSTTFVDESAAAITLTANGAAALTTTGAKFGTAALSVPGAGYMACPTLVANAPLDVATGNFTIRFWMFCPSVAGLFGVFEYGTYLSGTGLRAYVNGGGFTVQATAFHGWGDLTGTVTAGAWNFIEITRDGPNGRLFINGVQVGGTQTTWTGSWNFSGTHRFGANISFGSMTGLLDDIEVFKGTALHIANYPVPTAAFGDEPLPASLTATLGVDRREHEWTSLDGQPWIAQGTSKKLYVINRGLRYDITPIRRSVTITDPFTTTNGSAVVTVLDVLHGAETGDYVRYSQSTSVGGLTIYGEYEITVINGSQYTITASTTATSGATGGGAIVVQYDLNAGLVDAEQAHGWGTCTYGTGTYGTRRGTCSGIILGPRIWSLDNFGEDLLASPRGGSLYWWDRTLGPTSRAVLVPTAPVTIEHMMVSPSGDQVIALGAFDNVAGSPDKMLIRTSDLGTFADWDLPIDPDEAEASSIFDYRLSTGSKIITGIKTRRGIVVNTDKMSYFMQSDSTDVYSIEPLAAENAPVGPNAGIDVNGVAFWMAKDKFVTFDGVQAEIPCEVWGYVFDNSEDTNTPGLNISQLDKVYAYYNARGDEVTWLYPSLDSDENDRYVCFNRSERVWYYGTMSRTAMSTGGIAYSLPYGSDPSGELFLHEGVPDADGELMDEYIESWDMQLGDGDAAMHLSMFVPNFKRWAGTMEMQLKVKDRPMQIAYFTTTYSMEDDTIEQGVRACGRAIAVRFGSTELGSSWRMGNGLFYGQADGQR